MRWTLLAALLLTPLAAQAHVVLDLTEAAANAYVRVVFRVGHGCRGAATTRLAVTLPEGVALARPQPKPGWTLAAREAPTDMIVWEGGPLDDQHYDEFVLLIKTPDRAGATLRFPVAQGCTGGRVANWDGTDAPTLRLIARARQ